MNIRYKNSKFQINNYNVLNKCIEEDNFVQLKQVLPPTYDFDVSDFSNDEEAVKPEVTWDFDNFESETSDSSSSSEDSSDGSNKCTLGYIWLNIMACQTLNGENYNKTIYK